MSLTTISALLLGLARLDAHQLVEQFTVSIVLMISPAAFLTGTIVAWLAMFYPHTLRTWHPPWQETPGRPRGR